MKIRIGDKIVDAEVDKNGVPIVSGCWSEEIDRGNGRMDCIVHVPCVQIAAKAKEN